MAQAQRGRANMSVPKTTRDNRVIITGQTDYTVQCCHGLHTAHQQHQRNTLRQLNSLSDISQLFFFRPWKWFSCVSGVTQQGQTRKTISFPGCIVLSVQDRWHPSGYYLIQ